MGSSLGGPIKYYNLEKKTTLTQFDVLPFDIQRTKLLFVARRSENMADMAKRLGWKPASLATRGIKLGVWQVINNIFREQLEAEQDEPNECQAVPAMGGRYPIRYKIRRKNELGGIQLWPHWDGKEKE